jgi:hypothetical protein
MHRTRVESNNIDVHWRFMIMLCVYDMLEVARTTSMLEILCLTWKERVS